MLRQEINLYQTEKPTISKGFSWLQFLYLVLAMLIFFTALTIYSFWELYQLHNTKIKLQHSVVGLQTKFTQLKSRYPSFFFSNDINQSISQLQQELVVQQKLLLSITSHTPFSKILISLSNSIVPDVWLREIALSKGGTEISLKGQAIAAEKVEQYIKSLQADKIFAAYDINLKDIENPATTTSQKTSLAFEIALIKRTT